jgi:CheY-like chemotaxis protein
LTSPLSPAPDETGADPRGRSLHVLLVEDHGDTAEAIALLLRRGGHRVTVARTAAAGLAAAERGGIDLVVSDLGLPDGDGYELMRTLAGRHRLRGIALTGYGMDEKDAESSRAAGFDLHLTKPVRVDVLSAAIRQVAAWRP